MVIASSPVPSTTRSPSSCTDTSVSPAALAMALAIRSSGDFPHAARASTSSPDATYATVPITPLQTAGGAREDAAGRPKRPVSSAEQGPQAGLDTPSVFVEPVAFRAPGRKARVDLVPVRGRMVRVQQVAQLVHEDVLERRGSRQHQRQVQ